MHRRIIETTQTAYTKQIATTKQLKILPTYKQELLDKLLEKYLEVFRDRPGKIKGCKCEIKFKVNSLIYVRPHPIPLSKQSAEDGEFKRMLETRIIT